MLASWLQEIEKAQEVDWTSARCSDGAGSMAGLFFSDEIQDIARAKAICNLCALVDPCFRGAVERREPCGVWDYLGGVLVCREAGAEVVDAQGRDLLVLDPDARRTPLAAATPALLADLQAARGTW